MNDFLQQLRSGKTNNQKRRQYDQNKNLIYDRRNNKDPRRNAQRVASTPEHFNAITVEVMTAIRDLLQGLVDNQERLIVAEERKAGALENLAEQAKNMSQNGLIRPGGFALSDLEEMRKAKKRAKKDADPHRKRVMELIYGMRQKNATYQEIADKLTNDNVPTFSHRGKWHAQTVHRLFQED